MLVATRYAFAVLLQNGEVVCWGNESFKNVLCWQRALHLYSSDTMFTAILEDNEVITWNSGTWNSGKQHLVINSIHCGTPYSFVALTKNGELVSWGADGSDANIPQGKFTSLLCASNMLAVYTNKTVLVWKHHFPSPYRYDHVETIHASRYTFVLKMPTNITILSRYPRT